MSPRAAQRALNVRYYAANREREYERVRSRQIATTLFLRSLKNVPCVDCGIRLDPHQMDFDHRDPSTKSFQIMSGRTLLMSREKLSAEVEKCDVVCANCHRVRSRRQHRKRLAERDLSAPRNPRIAEQRERWRHNADILDQLRSVPCSDCGGSFPQCCMDFDHLDPATKRDGVTRMISHASLERILAEVDKCEIVCANCHRARTYRRRTERE
jgi:hypothetical protein